MRKREWRDWDDRRYKVLEGRERFPWPRHQKEDVVSITSQQLQWLLEGYDVWKMKPHQTLHFSRTT